MRIIHLADLHVGAKNAEQRNIGDLIQKATREYLTKIAEIIIKHKPDAVIIAGDLFDNAKEMVSLADLMYVTNALKILKEEKIPVIAIEGNHDKPREIETPKGKILMSPIRYLESLGYLIRVGTMSSEHLEQYKETIQAIESSYNNVEVKIAEIPGFSGKLFEKYVILNDTAFLGVEHRNVTATNPRILETMSLLFRSIGKIPVKVEKKVFIAHQTFDGIVPVQDIVHYKNEAISVAYLPEGFDYYALGHIHQFLESYKGYAHIIYPGIITPIAVDEFDYTYAQGELKTTKHANKGMILYDLEEKNYERIKVKGFRSIRIFISQEAPDLPNLMSKINANIQRSIVKAKDIDTKENFDVLHDKEAIVVDVESKNYKIFQNVDMRIIIEGIEQKFDVHANINVRLPKIEKEDIEELKGYEEYDFSKDIAEIFKNAFGDSYPLYIRFIEAMSSKKDLDVRRDSKLILEAVKDALAILYGEDADISKMLRAFARHVTKTEIIEELWKPPKESIKEFEEELKKAEQIEDKKEPKEKTKPKKKGMRTLFDLG